MTLRDLVVHAARATLGQATPQAATDMPYVPPAMPLDPRVLACRQMVTRKALLAAGAALVPIPGLDIAADVALLMRLLHQINERFGLTQAQIEALSPDRKALAFKAMTTVGSTLVGSAITRQLVIQVLQRVGVRLTAKQLARYVPLAGQALSAALAYSAMRYVCHQHINDCARVASVLALPSSSSSRKS